MSKSVYQIPYEKLPYGCRVVIYGAGKVGMHIYYRLKGSDYLNVVAIVDSNPADKLVDSGVLLDYPMALKKLEYDFVIIADESETTTDTIAIELASMGIPENKLIRTCTSAGSNMDNKAYEYIKFLERNFGTERNKVFIFMMPEHGNAGDYAIGCAEEIFFRKYFPQMQVVTVATAEWINSRDLIIPFVGSNDLICLNGGGYIGDLWEGNTAVYQSIVSAFPNNTKIFMPNTLTYAKELDSSNKSFLNDMNFLVNQKNCYLFFRDQASYQICKARGCNAFLYPDMALFLNPEKKQDHNLGEEHSVMLCLRHDRERVVDVRERVLSELGNNCKVDEFDINLKRYVSRDQAELLVSMIFTKMKRYDLIVTDRLHGMVLAFVCGVPCIAFDNSTHKVKGVYKWIENCNYVKLLNASDIGHLSKTAKELFGLRECSFDETQKLEHHFEHMADLIKMLMI